MDALSDTEMTKVVELIRQRADVPRVRSSEIKKIVETLRSLVDQGIVLIKLPETA